MKQILAFIALISVIMTTPAAANGWRLIPMADAPSDLTGPDIAIRCAALGAYVQKTGERADGQAVREKYIEIALAIAGPISPMSPDELKEAAGAEIDRLATAYEDTIKDPEFDADIVSSDWDYCGDFTPAD